MTPIAASLARGRGWIDEPLMPLKVHSTPVPRAGGLALWPVLCVVSLIGLSSAGILNVYAAGAIGLLVAGTSALVAGVLDDTRGADPWLRLSIESIGASVAVALGYSLPLSGIPAVDAVLSAVLLVGFANSFNLVDGIDGLAAGLAAIASAYLALLGAAAGDMLVAIAGASLAGCSLGFLRHNFSDKKVFLGDGGSLFLGMTLAVLAIRVAQSGGGPRLNLAIPFIVLAIPALDTAYAVLRRLLSRKPLFLGDRSHIYDSMMARNLTSRTTLLVLLGMCCLSGVLSAGRVAGWLPAAAVGFGISAAVCVTLPFNNSKPSSFRRSRSDP